MATWTLRHLESKQEQRNSGWSRSAHTPIKRIREHRDTISSPAVLYKRFNRHERPMLSQNCSFHSSMFVYIHATTTHLRHLTKNSTSIMTSVAVRYKKSISIIETVLSIDYRYIDFLASYFSDRSRGIDRVGDN